MENFIIEIKTKNIEISPVSGKYQLDASEKEYLNKKLKETFKNEVEKVLMQINYLELYHEQLQTCFIVNFGFEVSENKPL